MDSGGYFPGIEAVRADPPPPQFYKCQGFESMQYKLPFLPYIIKIW